MTAQPKASLTYAEYLAREAGADLKHEFVNGDVYARAGGTREHGAITAALVRIIGAALQGKACRVFSSDVRVRVESTGGGFYPDLSVVCGKLETPSDDPQAIANPLVLVEVLSDGTEAYDRGAKAGHYRRLKSLREYVLASQSERRIEVQRLNEHGTWELHFFGPGEQVELSSCGISFALDPVYAYPLG